MLILPELTQLTNQEQFRIIPSVYPPINFFEDLVDPAEMETLFAIENLTNERLRQEVGDIFLVADEDKVSGPGATVVMAAFTHIGKPRRFNDETFGAYYASFTMATAIQETVYHREQFLNATMEPACEITMRVYRGTVLKPLHDVRSNAYRHLYDPSDYRASQQFAKELKNSRSWGLVYSSVRHSGGVCIAALRPPAISIPVPAMHLRYVWNGKKITDVFTATAIS